MENLETYIARRKKEDKLNEFDIELREKNIERSVNYIYDYYNNYLEKYELEQFNRLNNSSIKNFEDEIKLYDRLVQEWLSEIYIIHGKFLHRSIIYLLMKNDLFLLYNTENEFSKCTNTCYNNLITENPFIKGNKHKLNIFIKNYHKLRNERDKNPFFLNENDSYLEDYTKND